jgi:hypothetical protein
MLRGSHVCTKDTSSVPLSTLTRCIADFEVTDPLPNISFALPRSYAGSLSTQTVGYANNSAFFWGFEKQNGSLTQASSLPWGLWLAGGPGYSSIAGEKKISIGSFGLVSSRAGMLLENGPISATKTGWEYRNTSMHQLADWVGESLVPSVSSHLVLAFSSG